MQGEVSRLVVGITQRTCDRALESVWIAELVTRYGEGAVEYFGVEAEDVLRLQIDEICVWPLAQR